MTFASLGLSPNLLKAIQEEGYAAPYPIQQKVIPALLRGKDILGIAKTGSGKTASFVLPILERLQHESQGKGRNVRVLILAPTRELAIQIKDVFHTFEKAVSRHVKTLAVFGGVSINPQMKALMGVEVLVATPGRLLDLLAQNAVGLRSTEILVLDEADKMLGLGFAEEMKEIFRLLPENRQTLLFSATMDQKVGEIHKLALKQPLTFDMGEEEEIDLELIDQLAYAVTPENKGPFLRYLIKSQDLRQVLVFVSATRTADNLTVKLQKNGIDAAAIHGQKSQGGRMEALARFKAGKLRVLIATDLMSRGIDIQSLPVVINYELPRSPKDYVHRIGRTGRAESKGTAISLVVPDDAHHFRIIQKKMRKRVDILPSDEVDLQGF